MAKINHHNFNDTINDLLIEAETRGVIQLNFESKFWEGSKMLVGNQEMKNFGTCGYLGLEFHPKIIEKSIEFTKKFGTQFSVSRTYLKSRDSILLEEMLSEIFFNKNVISFTSTTMLHSAVIPSIVGYRDLIILDQQCHASIQTATQLVVTKGVKIEVIRHSNLDMLEKKIKELRNNHDKIWYMIDGVYSMFGDIAPIDEINELMNKYPQLHLYVDDAHGMSWFGKNGCGRIFEKTIQNERTMYVSTMAKGFGVMGGIAVFPNKEWYNKVIIYGGSLTHSHPIPPPMLGASIASAEIHLSDEIYELQYALREKLKFANLMFQNADLPIISNPETPIYFLGTGQPSVGYNLNKRILDDGFFVNIGMFPAVPIKNTGLRFTITNNNSKDDIKDLVECLKYHYPKALEEENCSQNEIRRAFRLPLQIEKQSEKLVESDNFIIIYSNSISEIDKKSWDNCFENKGNFDYDSLELMEKSFKNNKKIEDNWNFEYIVIKDLENKVILATFLTSGIMKDDLLSKTEVSFLIEQKRLADPYYLCSNTLVMGSLFTEGEHLYLDKQNSEWKSCLKILLNRITEIQKESNIQNTILRDFSVEESELFSIFHNEGYFKFTMPNSNVILDLQKEKEKEYIETLSTKSRRNIRSEVVRIAEKSIYEVKNKLSLTELEKFYEFFTKVNNKNLAINIFKYPYKVFEQLNEKENWEFGLLKSNNLENEILGIVVCFKSKNNYFPLEIGFEYSKNNEFFTYKSLLYNLTLNARNRGFSKIHFGVSADFEKKKLGATQIEKYAFISTQDQFNFDVIDKISVSN